MRLRMGGCVENKLEKSAPAVSGWMMNMCAIDGETCMGTRFDHLSI